MPPRSST